MATIILVFRFFSGFWWQKSIRWGFKMTPWLGLAKLFRVISNLWWRNWYFWDIAKWSKFVDLLHQVELHNWYLTCVSLDLEVQGFLLGETEFFFACFDDMICFLMSILLNPTKQIQQIHASIPVIFSCFRVPKFLKRVWSYFSPPSQFFCLKPT